MGKEIDKVLNNFGKYVVKQSRTNLSKNKSNVSRELYNSIAYDFDKTKLGYEFYFEMEDYGKFQDQGVRGVNPSLVKNGRQKAPLSKFKYTNKMPPLQPLFKWVRARRIRLRDEKGKFKQGDYKTIAFIIQKRIFAQGVEATEFFTRPFNSAFFDLDDKILEAFNNDLDEILKEKIDD